MDRVCNTVQEAVTKTIPKKTKCKKTKWLSQEALQIAEERREAKGKGEREKYTQLNAEFQRINSKERQESLLKGPMQRNRENNRMGKTRYLFNKIRDTKGTFPTIKGTIKDRNVKDLNRRD